MAYFIKFYQNLWFLLGKADELKVAAVNKNGAGEFSHITPVHVVKGMLSIQIIKLLFNTFSSSTLEETGNAQMVHKSSLRFNNTSIL